MIELINRIMNGVFGLLMRPFGSAWSGMIAVSLVAAALVMLIFKAVSDPAGIGRRRNRTIARVLELLLFKDDIVVNLGALGRVIAANLRYLGSLIKPLLVCLVPLLLITVQVHAWFAHRPLRPGETALVTVGFADGYPVMDQCVSIADSDHFAVEPLPVRIPARNESVWRLAAREYGSDPLLLLVNGDPITKTMVVSDRPRPASAVRRKGGAWTRLLDPAEPLLPADSALESIEISYPAADLPLAGRNTHWLVAFLVLSLLFGLVLKKPFRVEI